MTKCDRCHKETTIHSMSFFNTDMICPDCEEKERQHPQYAEAKRIETEHCQRGDYNFKGIGKPSDL